MPEEVSYGFKKVHPSEKRRLVLGHFEAIARRYDLADALLSFGLHFLWRRRAMRRLRLHIGDRVLDLCGGTGDFAVAAAKAVGSAGMVVVCDISRAMMGAGRRKAARAGVSDRIVWIQGDAERMGFARDSFDAVIVGYGIRNFVVLEQGLREMHRVLAPGGTCMAMEFSIPSTPWVRRLYQFYSFRILPWAGALITGTAAPFHYLSESIRVFPAPEQVQNLMTANGFANTSFERLSNGLAVLYSGKKRSPNIPSSTPSQPPFRNFPVSP
ncbi:ubiquinone/menaquinone biosynthesis methyltransferase [Desulfonatronum lacustre]|uniref:ubiquinone/menaquinone biosynthesis methyltransferase n=1 Tax=Desulfonatronum lacustre TaxID=66849 RepID=UPI0004AC68DA|nr:ubiquinone/menaquinone biosynthesis methyltransferase [Desulfonatronum lacustre]